MGIDGFNPDYESYVAEAVDADDLAYPLDRDRAAALDLRDPLLDLVDVAERPQSPERAISDECGVFAIHATSKKQNVDGIPNGTKKRQRTAAWRTYYGLYTQQSRGHESAGILTKTRKGKFRERRGMGLVSQVFSKESRLEDLAGDEAIGHVRYSTAGSSRIENAQPMPTVETQDGFGRMALATNGQFTNVSEMLETLHVRGVTLNEVFAGDLHFDAKLTDTEHSDTRIATALMWSSPGDTWRDKIRQFMRDAEGGYSIVMMTDEGILAFRDPKGIRPLSIGQRALSQTPAWGAASESAALLTADLTHNIRSLLPGEVVQINDKGIKTILHDPVGDPAFCVFESIYLARPDSEFREGEQVQLVRHRIGRELALEAPVMDADVVIGVPDSGMPSAHGYADVIQELHRAQYLERLAVVKQALDQAIRAGRTEAELLALLEEYNALTTDQSGDHVTSKLDTGFVKNRYVARTFIDPDPEFRSRKVRLKLNAIKEIIRGRKVVVVDDSLVRGNTGPQIVERLRSVGAVEVHLRIASPPVKHPCYMGIDMSTEEELIANHYPDSAAIAEYMGADSLEYLSLEGMYRATREAENTVCDACFTGNYPVNVSGARDSDHC